MKRHENHLAHALEQLLGAAECLATPAAHRCAPAVSEWRREYGVTLAIEHARRALARHRSSSLRVPAEVLLGLRGRT